MANTASARKAARKIARRTVVNRARRSRLRTVERAVHDAIAAGDVGKAREALALAEPEIMRVAQKGVIHRKAAARKVSRLVHRIRKLGS